MSILLHGDCLELMKDLEDNSIDLIFCDLPYGQTSCAWDCCIDLEQFWIQVMRIKKLNCPIFMTTTTKFGVSLINSAPKKCPFRYDIVWVKSAPAGFLSAKKMPMRKHEMIYVFYEKLPFYDLSSHTHKFIKEEDKYKNGTINSKTYDIPNKSKGGMYRSPAGQYKTPLPISVVKEEVYCEYKQQGSQGVNYDPPLPVSVVKESTINSENYGTDNRKNPLKQQGSQGVNYDPPLPVSVVKEENKMVVPDSDLYGKVPREQSREMGGCQVRYDPPLPVSVLKEEEKNSNKNSELYGQLKDNGYYHKRKKGETTAYDPPLPVSIVKESEPEPEPEEEDLYHNGNRKGGFGGEDKGLGAVYQDPTLISSQDVHKKNGLKSQGYDPPLPNTLLEIKSTRGKHSTEKPVALMSWILKYYSKEGDTVLDPTMGSGSTGVSCREMKRNFIGFEKDPEIYEVAVNRIEE